MPETAVKAKDRTILFPYAGDVMGGSVISSFLLIKALLEGGRKPVTVFHGTGPTHDLAVRHGFPTLMLPPLGDVSEMGRSDGVRLGNYRPTASAVGLIRQSGAALIHVNDKRMLRTWSLPALLTRRALLNHWRSVYKPSLSIDLGLRVARRTIAISRYSRDLLPAWVRDRTEVVDNPFQPVSVAPAVAAKLREQAGIPPEAAVIGCFGTLLRRKRSAMIFDLLDAIERTADGRPVYGLVCGGWGEPRDTDFADALAARRHAGRFIWPGHVGNVLEWMAACDVVIAPAIDEPLGRVAVEAQSLGLAPVVSSVGGPKEVVAHGETGFVIDPYDMAGWITQVRQLIDDQDLRRRMSAACIASAGRLSVERHAERVAAIYDEILA
jgi:glycosyltransferase involved in cell wall biosynthesis